MPKRGVILWSVLLLSGVGIHPPHAGPHDLPERADRSTATDGVD